MTCRNAIFYATLIGSLLPIGLWAAAERATSFVGSPLVSRDLWCCMALMIVCSLAIPAGRKRFSRIQGLLITLGGTATMVLAAANLKSLAAGDPEAPVRMAAYGMEALMGAVVLVGFGVARLRERRLEPTDHQALLEVIKAACLEGKNAGCPGLQRQN